MAAVLSGRRPAERAPPATRPVRATAAPSSPRACAGCSASACRPPRSSRSRSPRSRGDRARRTAPADRARGPPDRPDRRELTFMVPLASRRPARYASARRSGGRDRRGRGAPAGRRCCSASASWPRPACAFVPARVLRASRTTGVVGVGSSCCWSRRVPALRRRAGRRHRRAARRRRHAHADAGEPGGLLCWGFRRATCCASAAAGAWSGSGSGSRWA